MPTKVVLVTILTVIYVGLVWLLTTNKVELSNSIKIILIFVATLVIFINIVIGVAHKPML